jgi:glycosyltransferase involved in cell wall biosynthesis
MEPVVSIIIAVYNSEEYLRETLLSISALKFPNVEVVLVDDGSTDNSRQIANEYIQNSLNARLFVQSNQGASAARNTGIALAKGKYILPFDSDDILCENFLDEAVRILENDEQVKVVTSNAVFFGDESGIWNLPDFSLFALAHQNMLPVCCMYRKGDWERVGGYCRDLPGREDWDFWISLLKDGGKVVKLPLVGFKYRMHKT